MRLPVRRLFAVTAVLAPAMALAADGDASSAFERLALAALMVALIYVGNANVFRRMSIDRGTKVLRVGWRRLPIDWTVGSIVDYRSNEVDRSGMKTVTQWNAGVVNHNGLLLQTEFRIDRGEFFHVESPEGRVPISVATRNSVYLFKDQQGKRLVALWVVLNGEPHYLGFRIPQQFIQYPAAETTIEALTRPASWTMVPAIVLGYIVGELLAWFQFFGILLAFLSLPVFGLFLKVVMNARRERFVTDEVRPLLVDLSGERAADTPGSAGKIFLTPAEVQARREQEQALREQQGK